jgi:hypothetical protein
MFPFSANERSATRSRRPSSTVLGRLHQRRTRVVDQPGVAQPIEVPSTGQRTGTDVDKRSAEQILCAAAHVYPGLADYVVHILLWLFPAAWAPEVGVDPVALLRHATAARRRQCRRDVLLVLLTLGTVGTPVTVLAVHSGPLPAAVLTAVLVVAWAGRARVGRWLRAGWADAWSGDPLPRKRGTTRLAWALALLACAVLSAWHLRVLVPALVAAVLGVGLSWVVVIIDLGGAQRRAGAALARGARPRGLAPPLAPELEARLDGLAETNVVVFNAARADTPFVGSGYRLPAWSVLVDLNRGATDDSGREQPTSEVRVADLHAFLADQFSVETSVESSPSRELTSGHRLYVDGSRIPWDSGLLAGWPPVPCQPLPASDVDRHLDESQDAAHRRAYFYLQEVGRHGTIAVTLFVRAHRQGPVLTIEFVHHLLLPVAGDIEAAVAGLGTHRLDHWRAAIREGTRRVLPMMAGSPACWVRRIRDRVRVVHSRFAWRRAARWQRPFDFGSSESVREGLAMEVPTEAGHFAKEDLVRIHDHLQARVLGSIRQFLDARGVNTDQFDPRSTKFVHNEHTLNIATMQGGTVVNAPVSRMTQRRPSDGGSGEGTS